MNEPQKKDKLSIYIGFTLFVIIAGIAAVKQSENEKYAPIKQQLEEENALMNIRVIG
jgi:hypothetical protein